MDNPINNVIARAILASFTRRAAHGQGVTVPSLNACEKAATEIESTLQAAGVTTIQWFDDLDAAPKDEFIWVGRGHIPTDDGKGRYPGYVTEARWESSEGGFCFTSQLLDGKPLLCDRPTHWAYIPELKNKA